MPLLWGGKMNEECITFSQLQRLIREVDNQTAPDERLEMLRIKALLNLEYAKHKEIEVYWLAVRMHTLGMIYGIRKERRKKKKAAQRCSTERQEATKHTKV